MMGSNVPRYRDIWERYWSTVSAAVQSPFWDSPPDLAVASDLPWFVDAFDPERVVVDLGCGNGTQTAYLAERFPRTIGADVSPTAIRMARRTAFPSTVELQTLDVTSPAEVAAFSDRVGDANIYMRAVLHQIHPEHRPRFVDGLKRIMGSRGVLFMVELSESAEACFREISEQAGGRPEALTHVLEHGITPGLLRASDVDDLFDEYDVRSGPALINTACTLPGGECAQVPAFHALIRAKHPVTASHLQVPRRPEWSA